MNPPIKARKQISKNRILNRVKLNESKKLDEYFDHIGEQKKKTGNMKVTVTVTIIVETIGTIPKSLEKRLGKD